ncbi:MAG TPA: hypothetical protein VGI74_07815 [Streptosporangiaceae bacterium]
MAEGKKARRWPNTPPERQAEILAAAAAATRRRGNDRRIERVVERAGELTPEQLGRLRALLPDPGPDAAGATS